MPAASGSPSLFCFYFFFFTFLFSLGIYNERITRIEKNEVTHWLEKQKGYSY